MSTEDVEKKIECLAKRTTCLLMAVLSLLLSLESCRSLDADAMLKARIEVLERRTP